MLRLLSNASAVGRHGPETATFFEPRQDELLDRATTLEDELSFLRLLTTVGMQKRVVELLSEATLVVTDACLLRMFVKQFLQYRFTMTAAIRRRIHCLELFA